MAFIRDQIEYLKDNPQGYWFKRKLYGWGWVPVKWQGWALILIFIGLILWNGLALSDSPVPTDGELSLFFVRLALLIVLLLLICYKKGESPRWQWGRPKGK